MKVALGWISLLALLTAVYSPGFHGPFVFDDKINLASNAPLHIKDLGADSLRQAALSGISSALKRPVSMLSFGINYALGGDDPFYFKLTNLVIHLLNAGLAGLLVLGLSRASPALRVPAEQQHAFALIVAAVWALHPLQVTAVLYVVQRMTSLSALFTMLGLILYVAGRRQIDAGVRRGLLPIATAVLVCLPLAVLSKDNGILMVAYALVIEVFIFGQAAESTARRRARWIASALFIACAGATAVFLALRADAIAGDYAGRGLTLSQRLLTEGRVLVWYLRMILVPDLSQLGLIHDDWSLSDSLLAPPSTALAWLLLAALSLAGWLLRNRAPALGFAVAWFLAGQALESSIIPLDLVYEHRNYLPSLGVILGISALARSAGENAKLGARVAVPAAFAAVAVMAALTASRALEWRSVLEWSVAQVQRHPRSPANHYYLGMLYISLANQQRSTDARDQLAAKADEAFAEALALNPAMGGAQIARIMLLAELGRPIPDDMLTTLLTILHTQPLPSATQYPLIEMLDCAAGGNCKLTEAQLQQIVQATLGNPYCDGKLRGMLFESMAGYYGVTRKDDATAIRYAREAVATPGAPFSSNFVLVKWLTDSGLYEEALSVLANLDKLDISDQYKMPRQEWRKAIDERMRGPQVR